jgi:hypothetical protein
MGAGITKIGYPALCPNPYTDWFSGLGKEKPAQWGAFPSGSSVRFESIADAHIAVC